MMILHDHQVTLDRDIDIAHRNAARYVCAVSPTGSGKTVSFSHRLHKLNVPSAAIAHRSELVGQMSYALARFGVKHRVIGPKALVKQINQMHLTKLRRSFYDPNAQCAVVSVQTLCANMDKLKDWAKKVAYWITDEGHHLVQDNMWGSAVDLLSNAWGLGVTAHAGRADGKGLGVHADGYYHALVEGPKMRTLIEAQFLADYKIFCPPSNLDMTGAAIGSGGDWAKAEVSSRVKKSRVMGDVVSHYLRIAPGKLNIVFAPDIEIAEELAQKFRDAGVRAAAISSDTPVLERAALLGQFERREITVLVNVDLFGEGYDLPALEVVQFARPTASFQLYLQQFGRVLRMILGKTHGIVIDHVGNVFRHGLPDAYREETLDRREKRSGSKRTDAIPLIACLNPDCLTPYEAIHPVCPFCGYKPVPSSRSRPEFVDGDLGELDPATLQRMLGDINAQFEPPAIFNGASPLAIAGIRKKHWERCESQRELTETIAWWRGWQHYKGYSDAQSYRAFYFRFGVDVLGAQTLPRAEADALKLKITDHILAMKG